ncbi:MAG: hypothetical protein ACRDIY_23960 [Chloroflexota bacterium]
MIDTRARLHELVDQLAPEELTNAARYLEDLRVDRAARRRRLEEAAALLDPAEEKAIAEEHYTADVPWPPY